jgi:hypothetical protein
VRPIGYFAVLQGVEQVPVPAVQNATFEVLFRAETLKSLKFPPEIFLIPIIICIFATAN